MNHYTKELGSARKIRVSAIRAHRSLLYICSFDRWIVLINRRFVLSPVPLISPGGRTSRILSSRTRAIGAPKVPR